MHELSKALAAAVSAAAPSIVHVKTAQSRATGVVWSADGLIVTVAHRVDDEEVAVVTDDGETVEAEILGRDAGLDLAVLRIAKTDLSPLPQNHESDGDELAVGHLALALGRPGRSVRASLRIIGVLGPEMRTPSGGRLDRYIESDRRIPRGFSGGPLVGVDGRVIGINTSGLVRGTDLAIPLEAVTRSVQSVLAHGSVQRGYLGIGAYPVRLPAKIAAELGRERGALIIELEEGSPAEKAGLYLGDILVAFDGEPIAGPGEVRAYLHERGGSEVHARIVRAGALTDIRVTVGTRS